MSFICYKVLLIFVVDLSGEKLQLIIFLSSIVQYCKLYLFTKVLNRYSKIKNKIKFVAEIQISIIFII